MPLAGLTSSAIRAWAGQSSLHAQPQTVLSLLVEISMRLSIDADKSKQVFDSKPVPNSLVELTNELENLLRARPKGHSEST